MDNFGQYRKKKWDLAPFGISRGDIRSGYFCTPVGAYVIGWTGADGIHYCTVRGQGETVFAVCPMNAPGEYVHPVAVSFDDFLRLLLACGEESALNMAYAWTKDRFAAHMAENPPDASAVQALQDVTGLTPMEEPWDYIRGVQAAFDYRSLRFGRDYEEWAPPEPRVPASPAWAVYYSGNYCGTSKRERPGEEIAVNASFDWEGECWHVPAVYACGKGIVVEICGRIEPQRIADFIKKWDLPEREGEDIPPEEQEQMEAENPLEVDFRATLTLNGGDIHSEGGCSMSFVPESLTGILPDAEARWVIEHYALDSTKAWCLHRVRFPWSHGRREKIRSLSLRMKPRSVTLPGIRFTAETGTEIPFTHPVTGVRHTLAVTEITPETRNIRLPDMELPPHSVRLTFRITPDLPQSEIRVRDCGSGDEPRRRSGIPHGLLGESVAIIGGADGPTALVFGRRGDTQEGGLHMAYSAQYFDPPQKIGWRMVFSAVLRSEAEVQLLAQE